MSSLANSLVSSPIWQTGAKDTVKAVDVYSTNQADLVNDFPSRVTSFVKTLTTGIGFNNKTISNIVKTVTSSSFDKGTAITKIDSLLKSSGLSFNSLSSNVQTAVIQQLGIDSKTYNSGKALIGGAYTDIKDKNYKTLTGISSMLRGYLGEEVVSKLIDDSTEIAYVTSMLDSVDSWDMPATIDRIVKKVSSNENKAAIYKNVGANYTGSYSVDNIEALIKASPNDASALTASQPNLANLILANYKFKSGTTPTDYPRLTTQLVFILNELKPNWFQSTRNGADVLNLSVFSTISDDGYTLLTLSDSYHLPVMLAKLYPKEKIDVTAKRFYPKIIF